MANTLASIGYVGYGIESTEGDLAAPSIYLPVSAFNFDSTNDYITPEQIRGDRDRYISMSAAYAVSGTMDMELVPLGVRPLIKSALATAGTVSTSAYSGGGYQTALTPGSNDDTTFSFESSAADILVMRYGGIRVNTLEISAAFNEIVTASFGLEGTTRAKQGGTSTENYDEVLPFHFDGADVKVDGSLITNLKNFSFGINNNLDRIGTLRKTRSWSRSSYGMRDVTLSGAMDFQNTADYDLFLNETEFTVDIHLQGEVIPGGTSRYQLRIEIPRVRWNMVNAPLTAGDFIEQSVEADIKRPLDGSPILTLTIVNSESTSV